MSLLNAEKSDHGAAVTGQERKANMLFRTFDDGALAIFDLEVDQAVHLGPAKAAALRDHLIAVAGPVAATVDSKPSNPKDAIATNKLPLHLVSPIVKAYAAIAHFLGNVKYGAWNYRGAGARASVYRAALDRHVDLWWEGQDDDQVDGTPHLANALACINILIETQHGGNLIDDRPPSRWPQLVQLRARFEALMPRIRERYKDKAPHHYTIEDTAHAVTAPADRRPVIPQPKPYR